MTTDRNEFSARECRRVPQFVKPSNFKLFLAWQSKFIRVGTVGVEVSQQIGFRKRKMEFAGTFLACLNDNFAICHVNSDGAGNIESGVSQNSTRKPYSDAVFPII